ncbi:Kinase [Hexamita inflata]|uniref:CAMK CAMKL n=1 Tax=Hexamita inflata TaxID=28002 RepID=A0AA86UQ79_9EUKA|nr:CAMK CAMKL [Hexamita inflata]CAI9960387.1 CAMK CAMKL [Hexamita inflata]
MDIYQYFPVLVHLLDYFTSFHLEIAYTSAYAPVLDVYRCKVTPNKFDIYCFGSMIYELLSDHPPSHPIELYSEQHLRLIQRYSFVKADLLACSLLQNQQIRCDINYIVNHPFFKNIEYQQTAEEIHDLIDYKLTNSLTKSTVIQEEQPSYNNIFKGCNDEVNNLYTNKYKINLKTLQRMNPSKINTINNMNCLDIQFILHSYNDIQFGSFDLIKLDTDELFELRSESKSEVKINMNISGSLFKMPTTECTDANLVIQKTELKRMDSIFSVISAMADFDFEDEGESNQ